MILPSRLGAGEILRIDHRPGTGVRGAEFENRPLLLKSPKIVKVLGAHSQNAQKRSAKSRPMAGGPSANVISRVGADYYTNVEADFESAITILLTTLSKSKHVPASLAIFKKVRRCVNKTLCLIYRCGSRRSAHFGFIEARNVATASATSRPLAS